MSDGTHQRSLYKHVNSGGSFGASPLRQTIGLGTATRILRLTIDWPTSGLTQMFEDVEPGHIVRIVEGVDEIVVVQAPAFDL